MSAIKIKYIADGGVANKERLVLTVTAADNIGLYLAFSTKEITPGHVSSDLNNVYWFPDKEVRVGDLVILYTKSGNESQTDNGDGTKTYFYYWGLNKTVWNVSDDSAALIKIDQWDYKSKG